MNKHYMSRLFGASPMRPLQQHIAKVDECVKLLPELVEACSDGKLDEARRLYESISSLEGEADEIKREVRLNLPTNLFMPIPRVDLLDLLNAQDKMANRAQDIAGLMVGRRMLVPSEIREEFMGLVQAAVDTVAQAANTIRELDELMEAGFRGKEADIVEGMLQILGKMEHETDQRQIALRNSIFEIEAGLPPVEVMFLYQVINSIGVLADRAETVGHQLELLLAR